jgi:hypothetical protein
MTGYVANAGLNLAELTADARAQIEAHKQACLYRWKAARHLASTIFSTRGRPGWRVEAERMLKAAPELEQAARQMLNRMMEGDKK